MLEIEDFNESDRGKYFLKCNSALVSTEGIVDVAIRPKIVIPEDKIVSKCDGNVEVIAQYKAIPKPQIAVYKVMLLIYLKAKLIWFLNFGLL